MLQNSTGEEPVPLAEEHPLRKAPFIPSTWGPRGTERKCGLGQTCKRAQKINRPGLGGGEQRLCNAPPEAEPPSTGAAGGQSATSREGAELPDPHSCPGTGSEFQPQPRISAPFPVRSPRQKPFLTPHQSFLKSPKDTLCGSGPSAINPWRARGISQRLAGKEKSGMEKLEM